MQYIPSLKKSTMHFSGAHFSVSFSFLSPKIWIDLNCLHADIRSAPSLMSFRSRLKAYLFGKAYPPLQSLICSVPHSWFGTKLVVLSALESALQRLSAMKVFARIRMHNFFAWNYFSIFPCLACMWNPKP